MPLYARHSGIWKPQTGFLARDSGIWKPATQGFARDSGIWKQFLDTAFFTLVGVNQGSTVSISINGGTASGRQAGDLCIIMNSGRTSGSNPSSVVPSGFTELRNSGANEVRAIISAKILDGTETSVSGINGGDWETWALVVLRPAEPIIAFVDHDTSNNENTNGNPSPQTITVESGTAPIVAYGQMTARGDLTGLEFGDMYLVGDPEDVYGGFKLAHYQIFNPNDDLSNITYDMGDAGNANVVQSGWLSVVKASDVVTTLSFVASATSAGATATVPSTAQAGDLGVFIDQAQNSTTAPSIVVPSGWTMWGTDLRGGGSGPKPRGIVSYKILEEGDPNSSLTGMDSTTEDKIILVFRGDKPITFVTASTLNAQVTSSTPTGQSVTASGGTPPLVVIGVAGAHNTTAAFSTNTPSPDGSVATADANLLATYKNYNSSPANHSFGMNDLGEPFLASGYLSVI